MTWYSLAFLMVGTTTVSAGKGYLWELACGVIVTLPITYIAEEEKEKQSADLDISLPSPVLYSQAFVSSALSPIPFSGRAGLHL